jgi:hypothetical protein
MWMQQRLQLRCLWVMMQLAVLLQELLLQQGLAQRLFSRSLQESRCL